jgi:alkylresorcinol/alkylpyrone synthase
MPRIAGVATVVPSHKLPQEQVKALAYHTFKDAPGIELLLSVFDNSMIDMRCFARPLPWYQEEHTFTESNDAYIEAALDLSERAIQRVSDETAIGIGDIDAIIFISTTGLATPSVDALLCNRLPFNRHVKRIPIWGLGCAGGAAGISRAFDYTKAYPSARVLVVAVELCSLAFQPHNHDKSNIIATALFGDGAAACIITGDDLPSNGPSIIDTLSTIYADTIDVMGWRITSEGFHVVLSRDIPAIVRSLVNENVHQLLQANKLQLNDLQYFVAHPGGKKVLEAYCESLGISELDLRHSIGVLRDFGNMSSATVYFILERFLNEAPVGGGYGLLSALGPGFSSELVLLKW